jgi:hypothetical protein
MNRGIVSYKYSTDDSTRVHHSIYRNEKISSVPHVCLGTRILMQKQDSTQTFDHPYPQDLVIEVEVRVC